MLNKSSPFRDGTQFSHSAALRANQSSACRIQTISIYEKLLQIPITLPLQDQNRVMELGRVGACAKGEKK
jgi:hypothetical protein